MRTATTRWLRIRIRLTILGVVLKAIRNPVKAVSLFFVLRKKRRKLLGLPDISKFVFLDNRYFWSDNIPAWPSSRFNAFIKGEVIRSGSIRSENGPLHTLIFSVTNRCGLQCAHCYEWDRLGAEEYLDLKDLRLILKKLQLTGLTHIQFSGGEPLARFDDLLVLLALASRSMDSWILTSGFGLTFNKALQLKKAGLTGANISLDHWDEKAHNTFRNNDKAFYWAGEAAKNCKNAGILVSLSLCATKEFISKENLEKYYELARIWGAGFVRILEPRQTGRFRGLDVNLDAAQIHLIEDFYQRSYLDKKFLKHPIVAYPGYHQRRSGCFGAGIRYIYIDSRGDIHACPFCQGAVGNILKDSLEPAINALRKRGCHQFEKDLSGF